MSSDATEGSSSGSEELLGPGFRAVLGGRRRRLALLGALACLLGVSLLLARPPSPRRREPRGGKAHAAAPDVAEVESLRALALVRARAAAKDKAHRNSTLQADLLGIVHELYTYGSPGSATPAIEDNQRPDGCFRGLRSYTEDVLGAFNESKQIDAAAIVNRYEHAKMPLAVLHWGRDSSYVPCPGRTDWPARGNRVFEEWRLHWEDDYTPRLQHITINGKPSVTVEPFAKASAFVLLAYKSYDHPERAKWQLARHLPGWRLVVREVRSSGSGSLYDSDPVMLLQEVRTLDCALVFAGTNNGGNELFSSLEDYPTGYCGYKHVHAGYRNELWQLTKALWPRLRPKLAKCSRMLCVGHSMAGTMCELFAGCANRMAVGDPDFEQQKWLRGTPELMPEWPGVPPY